jgi:hypothetical protein
MRQSGAESSLELQCLFSVPELSEGVHFDAMNARGFATEAMPTFEPKEKSS